jgi:hypothetical protein
MNRRLVEVIAEGCGGLIGIAVMGAGRLVAFAHRRAYYRQ